MSDHLGTVCHCGRGLICPIHGQGKAWAEEKAAIDNEKMVRGLGRFEVIGPPLDYLRGYHDAIQDILKIKGDR